MFETCITLLDDDGIYPNETVLCDEVGFSYFKGIPLWFSVTHKENRAHSYNFIEKPTILKAAFLITRRDFPAYNFPPYSSKCAIYISSETKPDLSDILKRVKLIMRGTIKPPVLYGPTKSTSFEQSRSRIKAIRSRVEYLDLFHCKRKPFIQLLSEWRGGYSFAERKCSPKAVRRYYNLFVKSSRFIHIALYYYNNAASLTRKNYIEDAGINLHLTLEAIIRDYMDFHSIKNKRKAVESFISKVWPPDWETVYLDDLWKSRNQFLAHIDENMFTVDQNIHDPDEYCFDTFESITYLITRYIRYKNRLIKMTV